MKTPGAVFGRSAVRGSLSAGYGSPSPSQERTTKSGSPGGASGWQSQPGWSKSPWVNIFVINNSAVISSHLKYESFPSLKGMHVYMY